MISRVHGDVRRGYAKGETKCQLNSPNLLKQERRSPRKTPPRSDPQSSSSNLLISYPFPFEFTQKTYKDHCTVVPFYSYCKWVAACASLVSPLAERIIDQRCMTFLYLIIAALTLHNPDDNMKCAEFVKLHTCLTRVLWLWPSSRWLWAGRCG